MIFRDFLAHWTLLVTLLKNLNIDGAMLVFWASYARKCIYLWCSSFTLAHWTLFVTLRKNLTSSICRPYGVADGKKGYTQWVRHVDMWERLTKRRNPKDDRSDPEERPRITIAFVKHLLGPVSSAARGSMAVSCMQFPAGPMRGSFF